MAINKVDPADPDFSVIVRRIVKRAAKLSTCKRRQVGAAVFDLTGKLLATGHNKERPFDNGTARTCLEGDCPRGMAPYDEVPADSPYSDCIADHAEVVALGKAYGTEDQGQWFASPDIHMVVTHRPCHQCTALIDRLGISTFYLEDL